MEMTNTYRSTADKAAIGLSLLCALHCLALPLFLSLFPALVAIGFQDEGISSSLAQELSRYQQLSVASLEPKR